MEPTEPSCAHIVDNGHGIVFACQEPAHPDTPDQHFMKPTHKEPSHA